MLGGELSKSKASKILDSNYPDVSDAMDALAANDRQFIKLSRESGRRRPEKFYKITENGLRALLAVSMTSKESILISSQVFWRVILLLSVCSKQPISKEELDNYYRQFEESTLGYTPIYGYFFQSYFFDSMLDNWIQNLSNNSATQKVIECLAINRSITLNELIKKTSLKKEEIIEILKNNSLQADLGLTTLSSEHKVPSDFDVQKQYYTNIISHALINKTSNTYELSLFGVMLMFSLIRYHYVGIDTNRPHSTKVLDLFYNDIKPNMYCDIIAKNYSEKLPLIFEKWNFLQNQLGFLLYDSFDFLIYKKDGKSTASSIWIGGNKEFYEDIQALASNTRYHLTPLYVNGKTTLDNFQRNPSIMNDLRINPLRRKLYEIEELLSADIPLTKFPDQNSLSFANESEAARLYRVKTIEDIFKEELTFLFYLNLNTIAFSPYSKESFNPSNIDRSEREQWVAERKRMLDPGSPKDRLMAILTKDKEIKKWFTERISNIMNYQEQTFNTMSKFYNEILDSHKYIKRQQENKQIEENSRKSWDIFYKLEPHEYDIDKICSY